MNKDKIILDLCGGTGAWSNPYKNAGYTVINITLPKYDVMTYEPPNNVYGILVAPPCTFFSYARTNAKKPRDLKEGMRIVSACLNIIWECQYKTEKEMSKKTTLKFWALENPYGMLMYFLGAPVLIFNPYDYGDRYQKKTCLWGWFNIPKKKPIELTEEEKVKFATNSKKLPDIKDRGLFNTEGYDLPNGIDKRVCRRAITPPFFAEAFFRANQ